MNPLARLRLAGGGYPARGQVFPFPWCDCKLRPCPARSGLSSKAPFTTSLRGDWREPIFDDDTNRDALLTVVARYAGCVSKGKGIALWESALRGQIYLGDDAFVQRMQALVESPDAREVPRAQRTHEPNLLEWYLEHHERDEAIVRAYRDGGHTQTAIAKAAKLSVSRISRLLTAREAKGRT
ncbi:MAG: hypothetical protein U0973_09505 [Xanthomonadaceae bacterium]|nr:hypothetical protein [Xanthomonadaceae bacterium]